MARDATDEEVGDLSDWGRGHPFPAALGRADADLSFVEDVGSDPVQGVGLRERLGEQSLGLVDLHAAVTHCTAKRVMLALRLGHPQDIVEQQLSRV